MSMLIRRAFLGGEAPKPKLYVDDVFSTYLYTGNGSTQTINNGIDLAGEGGLVWLKGRDSGYPNFLTDTTRGASKILQSHYTFGQADQSPYGLYEFLSSGFSVSATTYNGYNNNGATFASWTFRRAPKFFDVVTYTGDGTSNRQIAHDLGAEPGFITAKATSTTGDWNSYHRSATGDLKLNATAAQSASRTLITAASDSTFTVSGAANTSGVQYVAYLWAHDPSEDGIIQCGSYVGSGASGHNVTIGFEPQFLIIRPANLLADWLAFDSMRGISTGSADNALKPNTSDAEIVGGNYLAVNATGITLETGGSAANASGQTYIYLAIRRPNKPPKTGAEVYNAIARTGTGANAVVTGVGFAPDFIHAQTRDSYGMNVTSDRLRGGTKALTSYNSSQEDTTSLTFDMGGFSSSYMWFTQSSPSINHFFRRAPGFFDVVCYTGDGTDNRVINHNLNAVPELIIQKRRDSTGEWRVYNPSFGAYAANASRNLNLHTNGALSTNGTVKTDSLTETQFLISAAPEVNASGGTFVTYLFASLPGISKVGSYTGNGSSQTIDCEFTTGARFILIKRTDASGDWYVWDTARGIISANDPHLSLNNTAAEVTTDDSVDPHASGFIVNQVAATNINVSAGQYIFLSIA